MNGAVRVLNGSGEAIPFGAVMRPTGSAVFNNKLYVSVGKPNGFLHRSYLVNCGRAIPAAGGSDGWGSRLWQDGLVGCDVATYGSPTADDEWGPADGSWLLQKNAPGFLITGGGTTINGIACYAATHGIIKQFIGKPDGAVTQGDTAGTAVSVWTKNFAADTNLNVAACVCFTSDLIAGDPVSGGWYSGGPIIAGLVC